MSKVGKKYFRVEYNGFIEQLEVKSIDCGVPTFSLSSLTSIKDDKYELLTMPVESRGATQSFSFEVIEGNQKEYFVNLKDAIKVSQERFERVVNPNGAYRVARYFDDAFEAFVSELMSKKDAADKADALNSAPRCYVSYGILPVKQIPIKNS